MLQQEFDAYARAYARTHEIPGCSIAFAQGGEVRYAAGIGYRDQEQGLPATLDTVYGIASLTKSFTALATMLLVDAGRLSVDDPVTRWLPELGWPDAAHLRDMTVHHLLTHSSGLPQVHAWMRMAVEHMRQDPHVSAFNLPFDPTAVAPLSSATDFIGYLSGLQFEPAGAPGQVFSYSNEGYMLLEIIVARAAGQSFPAFVRERILTPLGMTHTAFALSDLPAAAEVTQLYLWRRRPDGSKEVFAAPGWWEGGELYGHGMLKSTVRDLVTYLELFWRGGIAGGERIVSKEVIARITARHILDPNEAHYGYGLYIPAYRGVTLLNHAGGWKGISSFFAVVPERELAAVVLTNVSDAPVAQLVVQGIDRILGIG